MEKYKSHIHINKLIHNGYNDLVFSNTFRSFGISLIAIFLPIFLLTLGVSFQQLIIFEIIVLVLSLMFHFIVNYILNFIGVKKVLILSYIANIAFYLVLTEGKEIIAHIGITKALIIFGFLNALFTTLYWTSYHYYFIKSTHNKNKGSKLGVLVSVPVILSVLSPFIGGLLITRTGFSGAFIATIIFIVLGMFCLFFSKEIHVKTENNIKKILNFKDMKKNTLFFIEGAAMIGGGLLWPVLLYYLGVKILAMGFLYLVSNSLYSILTIWSGKMVDKQKYQIIRYGAIGHGISLIVRGFTRSLMGIISIQGVGGIFMPLWAIPIHSLFYKKSEKNSSNNIMNRELWMHLGRIFVLVILIILSAWFSIIPVLTTGLIICGTLMFCLNLVANRLF